MRQQICVVLGLPILPSGPWLCRYLPGGYTLDLDSTQLLHTGQQQEGVRLGYTPRGFKKSLHPLLAFIAEARLVAGFWLRPGHSRSDSNVVAFTQELLSWLLRRNPVAPGAGRFRASATRPWLDWLEERAPGLHCGGPLEPACATAF